MSQYILHISPSNFVVLHDALPIKVTESVIASHQFDSELTPREILDLFLQEYMGATAPTVQYRALSEGYTEYRVTL